MSTVESVMPSNHLVLCCPRSAGDLVLISGPGRYSGEWNCSPHQYSYLKNSMVGGSRWAAVHGIAKSQIWLINCTLYGGASGKGPPASAGDTRDMGLIPGSGRSPGEGHGNPLQYSYLEEPGRLQSIGSHRVGHDWSDLAHTQHTHMLFCIFKGWPQ